MPTSTSNTAPSFILPGTGIASVDMGYAQEMALQSDGKVVLGGYGGSSGYHDYSVVRLNADGSLDSSFSGDGKAVIDMGGNDEATSVVVQSDGKVVLGGYSSGNYSVVRLNADGSLDTSFSGDGKAVIDVGGYSDVATSMVVQSDGKLVLAGYSYTSSGYSDYSVVRLNADGSLDTGFSGDGKAVIDVDGDSDGARSLVVQSDGKVVLGGYSHDIMGTGSDFSVVRLNADGSLDTTFSGDGKAVIDVGRSYDEAYSMVLQSDGKVLLGGYSVSSTSSNADFSVVRLNADGSLDSSFSGDGKAVIDVGGSDDVANSLVVQSDGKVVLGGSSSSYSSGTWYYDYSVVRLNADGSLDTSFSGDGKAVIDVGSSYDYAYSLVVQPDGKLILGGIGGASRQSAVILLNADGSLDTSFGIEVNTLGGSVAYTEQAAPVVLDSSVVVRDTELAALNSGAGNYAGSSITLARAGGANAQDVFSAGSGLSVLTQGSYFAVNGATIGRVTTNSGGTLKLTFSAAATQTLVNQALSSIAYSNTSDGPPASVQIDWTFNDGNTTGSQGTGGALSTTGSTTVNITATNDAPTLANLLPDMKLVAGQAFSQQVPATTFTDPDADPLTYTAASADGTGLPPWLAFDAATRTLSGTPDALDVGMSFDVRLSARDASGATASDVFTVQVGNANNAPTASNRTLTATEDTARPLTVADFGFSDVDAGNTLQSVTITRLSSAGSLKLNGTAVTLNQVISAADIGTGKLVFTPAANANGTAYANWGFKVSDGTDLSASDYTMTVNVSAVNDTPTGSVSITGTAQQGQTLTAANTLADVDGLGTISYQWQANGSAITGATGSTLTLAQAQVGKTITVQARYTDGQGSAESVASSATTAVLNVNDAPTGSVTITGTAQQGQTLTAANTLADVDGLGTISYQWQANGSAISGATGSTFTLAQAQVGKTITVRASYTDGGGIAESKTSSTTVAVVNVNDAPTGSVTISGTAKQGQVLTASNTLADADGLGTISHQWLANGSAITGATGSTLTLTQAQVGKTITVQARYTDGFGFAESKTSSATVAVANVNDAPTASNRTLTATEDTARPLTVADFGFSDVDAGNTLQSVSITRLSSAGSLTLNGTAVTLNQVINATDISTGKLVFTPATNANGTAYANWGFKVSDGLALSASAYTMTVNVTAVRDDLTKTGTAGNDTLAGDTIDAGSHDSLSGLGGNDSLSGLAGNDTLDGGAGNDTLKGDSGADNMTGGDGSDTYYVDSTGDRVTETNATATTGGTDLVLSHLSAYTLGTNVENGRILATGTASMTGNTLNNVLYAGAGNNALNGSTGTDTVSYQYGVGAGVTTGVTLSLATTAAQATGGSGSDTLTAIENLIGSANADRLTGSSGNNALNGGAGNDTLSGGSGNDTLIGGVGKDALTGGAGNDIFDFNALSELGLDSATRDVITDFTVGQDKIDLSTIDANTSLAGDQAFAFVTTAFTTTAGQVRYSGGMVYLNTDTDTAAEYAIQLTGTVPAALTATNFVL